MQHIVIDTPVFTVDGNGTVNQLLSFNSRTNEFKCVNVNTGDTAYHKHSIDASEVYFKPQSRGPRKGDPRAISYLLNLGVSNIRNVPTEWAQFYRNNGIRMLLNALQEIESRSVVETVYIRDFNDHYIMDDELTALCSSVINPSGGRPLKSIVSILENHGFSVRKAHPRFGWDLIVIDTQVGKILFS